MKEYITHAAVLTTDGEIYTGKRHLEAIDKIKADGKEKSDNPFHEGFLTNEGRFVNRVIAARIAFAAGQTDKNELVLISENLWNPNAGGRFKYDPVIGYYE